MAKSLDQFIQQIKTAGGIRTSNMAEIEVSTGYPEIDAQLENITMYAESFELPTRTQEYNDVPFKAYPVPVASRMIMGQDHSMNIRADTDGAIRRAFLAWQAKVANPAIAKGSLFEGDRRPNEGSVMRVRLLANDMSKTAEVYKIVGVKVNEVGALTVSNTDSNVAVFPVTLKSIYWEIEDGTVADGAFKDQN